MPDFCLCVLRAATTAWIVMAAQPATALDIVTVFDPGLEGTVNAFDPDPISQLDVPLAACGQTPDLVRIVEAAAAHWESIIRDDHTVVLRYGWLAPTPDGTLPDAFVSEVDGTGRPVAGRIRIPLTSSYYYDPTPDIDEEWSAPTVWSSLNVSAWLAFGLSGRCSWALAVGSPKRCAV